MTTLNKAMLIGYLGHDPEMRSTAAGEPVAHLSLATTETWKDKASGEKKQATEWHRVVLYRKLAEIASQYLKKGSHVYIEGRLQTRKWIGRDEIERMTTEIVADEMRMVDPPPAAGSDAGRGGGETEGKAAAAPASARKAQQAESRQPPQYVDDEIPF